MKAEIILLEFLSNDSYIIVNKKLLMQYGPEVAIFLSNLIAKYKFFKQENQLLENQWFFLTHENQIQETGLTETKIRNCKSILRAQNVLETKRSGTPSKEYYKLNWNVILYEVFQLEVAGWTALRNREGLPSGFHMAINNNKYNKINNTHLFPTDEYITPKKFEKFWAIYPKKVDKGKALTSWNKLCTKKDKPTWKEIRKAIYAQIETDRWKNPKFIPAPTTWLNQSRWLDDPAEMKDYRDSSNPNSDYVPMFEENR